MSDSSTTKKSPSTQTPAIRTFQMDGSSQGNLASSVNLFRGDVNLSQTLFTLPGRAEGDGMDVQVAFQYQSNVFRAAQTWNAEAPTSILGLGWDMPLTRIEATTDGSPVPSARGYTLYDNGSPNQLFVQDVLPTLLSLPGAVTEDLLDGEDVPDSVRGEFVANGLALSASTKVRGSGPWTLIDDDLQQHFVLTESDAGVEVKDGGQTFQLQNYQFWRIVYYPDYERWVIISDAGQRRSLGGRLADTGDGFATSVGNSVAWSVWWQGGDGQPIWTGASGDTSGQVQVARAWYLASTTDRFGSTIRYNYNEWDRDSDGIVPEAEQRVGTGGLPYTKAIYLTSAVDVFGRTATFHYGNKLWDAEDSAPREYYDPHRATPSNDPGPYQDRYETRYLDSIEVTAASGASLFSVALIYAPRSSEDTDEANQVANVNSYSGTLEGDTYKRFLTGIVQRDQDGVAAPGLLMTYDLASGTPGGQPGALLSIAYPQGGVAHYTYEKQNLDLCDRSLTVDRPAGVPDGATPRVYFGADYVAVCFYNQTGLQLSLQVFTWVGSWLQWSSTDDALIDTQGIDLETLGVQAGADFMSLFFNRPDGELCVYVLERDTARPGQWRAATIEGTTTDLDSPTLSYSSVTGDAQFHGGDTFFVLSQMDSYNLNGSYEVLTWRWTTREWTRDPFTADEYSWLAAGASWYAVLDWSANLTVRGLDQRLAWTEVSASISGFSTMNTDDVAITPGAGLLVITDVSAQTGENIYTQRVVEWDAAWNLTIDTFDEFTDYFDSQGAPLDWHPVIVDDTLIATNGNLLRRDGSGWSRNTDLNPGVDERENYQQRFAVGPDYAIRLTVTTNGSNLANAHVIGFDPTLSGGWTDVVSPSDELTGNDSQPRDNWPNAGGADWATVGPYVYFRGTSTSWASVVADSAQQVLTDIASDYDSESLVNESPSFVSYMIDDGGNQSVQSLIIQNGIMSSAPDEFTDEQLYEPSDSGTSGPGTSPQGPQLFVTFPASESSMDTAQSVILHRYAGDAVAGPITHYTVTLVETDDGFGDKIPTAFEPDATTAAADPSGEIVKFYKNTVYPGAESADGASNGKVVNQYLNGLNELSGDNFYDMLDGLLVQTKIFDDSDTLVQSSTTDWTVLQEVGSSCTDSDAPVIQLRGGWVTQLQTEDMADGVTTTTNMTYVSPGMDLPTTGQLVTQTRTSYSGTGTVDTFTETRRYAAEFYPAAVAIRAYADPVQKSTTWTDGGTPVPLASAAQPYATWPSNLGDDVLAPAPEAAFQLYTDTDVDFPFASYQPGDDPDNTPDGWQLSSRTISRNGYGQETGSVDGLGAYSTVIYDANAEMSVATINNATRDECAYLGFQDYEDSTDWTLSGHRFDPDTTYTGTQSLVLEAGAGSVSVTVAPSRPETWLVGCRFRTPGSFTADDSGLVATVSVNGEPQSDVSLPWVGTGKQWLYVTLPVPIEAENSDIVEVQVEANNTTGSDIRLDCILVAPLVNSTTARAFDPGSQQVLSSMDAGGRCTRTFYDRAWSPSCAVGATGLVSEIQSSFLSRRGTVDDEFDPDSPNAELTLHSAGGGVIESFRDGGQWSTRWTPGNEADWSAADGALTYTGDEEDSLTWADTPTGTYAVHFEVQAAEDAIVQVAAGDVSVAWDGRWAGEQDGSSWTALASPPKMARQWLLVVSDGLVLFFGDGQLLFSEKVTPSSEIIAITASQGQSTYRNLTVAQDNRLGVSYNDAGSRQRQVHQLHDDDTMICELVFDALDRQIATTKNAPGSEGAGGSVPVMQYRSSFVDVAAFLAATASDWKMTGDVADYYAGQTSGDVVRSDDAGYPYWGARYEASPRKVKVETSLPGKDFAIGGGQSTRFEYGANEGSEPDLPAGEYAETRVISPVDAVSSRLETKDGNLVAATYSDPDGALLNQSAGSRSYAAPSAGPVATLSQQQPNALNDGPQSDAADYVKTTVANALKVTQSVTDTDTGTTEFVTDIAGALRFVQPALETDEQWYIYYKYDAIGRQIEQGTVADDWDRDKLQSEANNPDFPTGSDGATPTVVTTYDGDGSDPTLIGMKATTNTTNAATTAVSGGEVQVLETFGYDAAGQLASVAQELTGAVDASGTLAYTYDNLTQVLQVALPDGCPTDKLTYTYNDLGQVESIKDGDGNTLVEYSYRAEGDPQAQTTDAWTRTANYNAPGWVDTLNVQSTDEQSLNQSFTYEADGSMESRKQVFAFDDYDKTISDTFTYDGQRRLSRASGSSGADYTSYDPNNNLWAMTRDGAELSFQSAAGQNLLDQVDLGQGSEALSFNARGQMVSGLGREFEYDNTTGMTTAIQGDTGVRLAYGGSQQRVLKQTDEIATVYFSGAGKRPLVQLRDDAWSVAVYGPTGPVAWLDTQTNYLLTDLTGSVLAVVSGTELVGARSYLPFGLTLESHGNPDAVPMGFQGREFDIEVGLYNFGTRQYDPALRRFITPDPQRQFASPYTFAANSPLLVTDPSGETSTWAMVGIGVAMAGIAVAGVGLMILSGPGASAVGAGVAALEASLSSTAAGLASAATVGASIAGESVAAAVGAGAAAGAAAAAGASTGAATAVATLAAGSAEIAVGVAAGATAAGAAGTAGAASAWGSFAMGVAGSTLLGMGTNGLKYEIQHGRDMTASGLFTAMGIGAASGFVSGVVGGVLDPLTAGITASMSGMTGQAAKAAVGAATGAVSGVLSTDLKQVLTNVSEHQPWYQGLLKSTLTGAVTGAASGALKSAWSGRGELASKAAEKGWISAQRSTQIATIDTIARSTAWSDAAKASYAIAGFFLTTGYVVWGATTGFEDS